MGLSSGEGAQAPPAPPPGTQQAEGGEKSGLWRSILEQALAASSKKTPEKSVLVLGGRQSGKASLIARFKNIDMANVKKGMGLEYTYVDVSLDDDETARLSLWTLDSDPAYQPLMKYALSAETLEHTAVLLVVDMARPWTIMDSLQTWARTLQDHVDSLAIPLDAMQAQRQKMERFFREYSSRSPAGEGEEVLGVDKEREEVLVPLEKGVLDRNLGMPIVVVVTKCDTEVSNLRDEHFDFIQMKMRQFCLKYGAALVYTTATQSRNTDLLFKYMAHRLYGLAFTVPPQIMDRETVFVPTGWDSSNKIKALGDNMKLMAPEDDYEDVILKPSNKNASKEQTVRAEDEQVFLGRMKALLDRPDTMRTAGPRPASTDASRVAATVPSAAAAARSPAARPGATPVPADGGPSNQAVISNFFTSLIKNKKAPGPKPDATPEKPRTPTPRRQPHDGTGQ